MTAALPTVVPLSICVTTPAHSQATTYCPFYITGHVGARSNDVTFLKLNMHEISVFSLCANENFSLRHLLQEVPILLIKARLQGCAVFCVHFYDNGMSCFLSVFPGLFLTSCLLRLFIRVQATVYPVMSVGPLHYGLKAQHLRTKRIKAALWTHNKGRNWYSCLLKARKCVVLPPPYLIQSLIFLLEVNYFAQN